MITKKGEIRPIEKEKTAHQLYRMEYIPEPHDGLNLRKPTTRVAQTQLLIATTLGLFAFFTFCVVRNTWFKIYASRLHRRKGLPSLPRGSLFGWIPVILRINETELVDHAGLDAVVFLGFFKMAIKLLVLMAGCSILIISPVRYHYTGRYDQGDGDDDGAPTNRTTVARKLFRRMAITGLSGLTANSNTSDDPPSSPVQFVPYLWMYVAFTYIFTLLTLYTLLQHTKHVVRIRQTHLGHQNSITDRTIRLSGIPPQLRDEAVLKAHIEGLNIGKVQSITICREWGPLNKLFKRRNTVLEKLEDQWATYLGPLQISSTKQQLPVNPRARESFRLERSPIQRPFEDNNSDHTEDEDEEEEDQDIAMLDNDIEDDYRSVHEYARRQGAVTLSSEPYNHVRPTLRTGFLGLFGPKVDAIEYYTNQLDVIDQEIMRARQKHYPATPTAFIIMESVASAQMAAQAVLDPKVHHLITRLAPAPHDIIWDNIVLSRKERLLKLYAITVIIGILSVSLVVPVGYLATLLNPKTIRKFWPGLADFLEKNEWARNIVSGLLPTYLFTIMNFAIPFLYVWLSSKQGFISHGDEELSAVSKNFFYIFVNLFLVFTTAGTASNYWGFISDTSQLAFQLAQSLNELSLFYVDLIILQGIGMFPFKLLLLGSVLQFPFFKAGCRTPRDYRELYKPPVFNFGLHLPQPILILIITIIYSVFSSKILLSGLAYFVVGYYVYKYQLMYAVVHPPHSTGKVWPVVFRRIIVGLLLFQLTMVGSLAAYQDGYILAMVLLPLPFVTISVLWNFQKHYIPLSNFIALRAITNDVSGPDVDEEDVVGDGCLTIHSEGNEVNTVQHHSTTSAKSRTLDEIREKDQTYEYPYLVEPLDGPWISIEGDEIVVANSEGTVRKRVNLMEWE